MGSVSRNGAPGKGRAPSNSPGDGQARAVLYARVSTKEQAGERHLSLGTQRERYEDWCRRNRAIPVPDGIFVDVIPGRKDTREDYQRMLRYLAADGADVVVVQFLDRFGRNTPEIVTRWFALEKTGVRVVATDEPEVDDNPLMMMVKAWQAGQESEKNAKRVLPNMEAAARKGRWPGRAPFGYILVQDPHSPDFGKLRVDPERAAIAVRIFERYAEGKIGRHAIGKDLNAAGVRLDGKLWAPETISKILRNRAYIGQLVWNGTEVPDGCPAIIDRALWDRVQATLSRRAKGWTRRGPSPAFPLEGLVWCGCGSRRHNHHHNYAAKSGREAPRYYRCTLTQRAKASCRNVRAEGLEEWVLGEVARWEVPAEAIAVAWEERTAVAREEARKVAAERERLEASIARCQERISRTYDRMADGELSVAEYTAKAAEYKEAIDQARDDLANLPAILPDADPALDRWYGSLLQFRELLPLLRKEPERLAAELAELVDRIVVSEDGETWEVWPRQELGDLLHASVTRNRGKGPNLRLVAREQAGPPLGRIVNDG